MFTKGLAVLAAISASCLLSLTAMAETASDAPKGGAKGLYFEQLEQPKQQLNTGLRYYIELVRDGKMQKVNNKVAFRSGDKIRFHVQSNIDGYAYILLKSGSKGDRSVLFPAPYRSEDNRVKRGHDYALPTQGMLAFDANPGLEKLSLLLSRTPLDATAYLNQEETTLIACADIGDGNPLGGSKDLIPSKIIVAYTPPVVAAAAPATAAAVPLQEVTEKSTPKTTAKGSSGKKPTPRVVRTAKRPVKAPVKTATATPSAPPASDHLPFVTIVDQDPSGVLAVDVALQHN